MENETYLTNQQIKGSLDLIQNNSDDNVVIEKYSQMEIQVAIESKDNRNNEIHTAAVTKEINQDIRN